MKIVKLEEICDIIAGQSPPSSTYNNDGIGLPFFQGKSDFGYIYPNIRQWCSNPIKIAFPNDILISVRAPVGPTNICNQKSCIGRGLSAIRVRSGVDFNYLFRYFRSIESNLSYSGRGSTFDAITQDDLKNLEVPLPPLEDQIRIANILDKADEIRQKRRESLKLCDEYLRSVFLDMFGDPVTNPKGWEVKKLGEFITYNQLGLVRGTKEQNHQFKYNYIKMDSIRGNGNLDLSKSVNVDANANEIELYKLEKNDFLFNTRNSKELVGKTALFLSGNLYLFNNNILRLRFNSELIPIYLNFLFQSFFIQSQLDQIKSGTTSVFAIYYKNLVNINILKPPVDLQNKFSEIVQKTEALKLKMQEQLTESDNLFNSLMQRAFRGEI
jgi:type I restriction enzyme S subunit